MGGERRIPGSGTESSFAPGGPSIPVRYNPWQAMADADTDIPYGKIRGVPQIGAAIRRKRRAIGMRQAELAALSGVGTWLLSELENGKATAEIGKALQVLQRLGLDLWIEPRSAGSRRERR